MEFVSLCVEFTGGLSVFWSRVAGVAHSARAGETGCKEHCMEAGITGVAHVAPWNVTRLRTRAGTAGDFVFDGANLYGERDNIHILRVRTI